MASLITLSAAAILLSLIPTGEAHMALWSKATYGFGQDYDPVTPLAGLSFNQWWFHGNAGDNPTEVMSITPGQPLTVEISCRKKYSSFGVEASKDACPGDSGAYHAGGTTGDLLGWTGNNEASLMGCALAIAPKKNAASTNPADFVIMSVLEKCVRQRDTTFAIPANLPACPDGECTCAWFWQGRNAADEMYMTGFRCNVEGGSTAAWPKPAAPRKGKISGATQPVYWANDNSNLDFVPTYETRPSYNSAFGWTPGAQTASFGAGGVSNTGGGGANTTVPAGGAGTTRTGTTTRTGVATRPGTTAVTEPTAVPEQDDEDEGDDEDSGDTEDEETEEPEVVTPSTSSRWTRLTSGGGGTRSRVRPGAATAAETGADAGPTQWNNLAAVGTATPSPTEEEDEAEETGVVASPTEDEEETEETGEAGESEETGTAEGISKKKGGCADRKRRSRSRQTHA